LDVKGGESGRVRVETVARNSQDEYLMLQP
jgi:hypothetical protein